MLPANLGHALVLERDSTRSSKPRSVSEFLTDLSLVGGLMIASADTAGKPSLGWRGRRAAERLSERVSSALPGSDDAMFDGELGEKIVHGLQVGAERGRELASTAAERGAPYAEAALERGRELASTAAERGAPLAKKPASAARTGQQAAEKAEKARKRSEKLADARGREGRAARESARERGSELADTAARAAVSWPTPRANESASEIKSRRRKRPW